MRELVVGLGTSDDEVASVCAMLKLPPEVMHELAQKLKDGKQVYIVVRS